MSVTNTDPRITVRMYRQGLGDCFLLTIQEKNPETSELKDPVHMWIDFGVLMGTTDGKYRMKQVAKHIMETTGGEVDVLVGTHEHFDHLSGFNQARDVLEAKKPDKNDKDNPKEYPDSPINFRQVWLAWTENEDDDLANRLRKKRKRDEQAVHAALKKMKMLGLNNQPVRQLTALLGFALGDEEVPDDSTGLALTDEEKENEEEPVNETSARDMPSRYIKHALPYLRKKAEGPENELKYLYPGKTVGIEGIDGVRFYVLGPPRDEVMIKDSDPNKGEAYGFRGNFSQEASFQQALGLGGEDEGGISASHFLGKDYPFSRNYKIPFTKGEIYLLRNRIIQLLSKDNFEGLDKLLRKLLVDRFSAQIERLLEDPEEERDAVTIQHILSGQLIFSKTTSDDRQEDPSNDRLEIRMQNSLFDILRELLVKDEGNHQFMDKQSVAENKFSLVFQELIKNVFALRYGYRWEENVRDWVRDTLKNMLKEQAKTLIHLKLKSMLIESQKPAGNRSETKEEKGLVSVFENAKKALYFTDEQFELFKKWGWTS